MADKYMELYNKMEPGVVKAASAWGISASSLLAMSRRGLVEVIEGNPKLYRRKGRSIYKQIVEIVERYGVEYFTLHTKGAELGMLCRFKNGRVVDAWDRLYELTHVDKIIIRKDVSFELKEE